MITKPARQAMVFLLVVVAFLAVIAIVKQISRPQLNRISTLEVQATSMAADLATSVSKEASLETQVSVNAGDLQVLQTLAASTPATCSGPEDASLDGFLLQKVESIPPFYVRWWGVPIKIEVWGLPGGQPNESGNYLYSFTQADHPEICPCYLTFEGYTPKPGGRSLEDYWTYWGEHVDACSWGLYKNGNK